MNRDQALTTWAEALTPAESAALALGLQDDPALREELLEDRRIDGLLRLAASHSSSAEPFVDRVMQKIATGAPHMQEVIPPPVTPPPISRPAAPPPQILRVHRAERARVERAWSSSALVLTGLAALLIGITTGSVFNLVSHPKQPHHVPEVIEQLQVLTKKPDYLATLVPAGDADWVSSSTGRPLPLQVPLVAGKYDLRRGQSKLRMAGGSDLLVEGPASVELVDPHLVRLTRGEVHSTPARDGGFCVVRTPTGQVVDDGADFRVVVNENRDTRLQVQQGRLWLDPRTPDSAELRESPLVARGSPIMISMAPEGLREAVLTSRGAASLVGEVSGADGKFVGIVAEGGKALECPSREVFEKLVDSIEKRVAAAPDEFLAEWTRLVEQLGGKLEIDFKLPAEIPLPVPMPLPVPELPPGKVTSSFQGSIMVNGELKTFTSREEFDKAAGEMLKPLAEFGLDLKLDELPGALIPEDLKP